MGHERVPKCLCELDQKDVHTYDLAKEMEDDVVLLDDTSCNDMREQIDKQEHAIHYVEVVIPHLKDDQGDCARYHIWQKLEEKILCYKRKL